MNQNGNMQPGCMRNAANDPPKAFPTSRPPFANLFELNPIGERNKL